MNYIFFAAGESCPGRLGLSWFGIQEEEHTGQNDFICIPPFLAYCMLHTLLTERKYFIKFFMSLLPIVCKVFMPL
jgi:hypothetical protein